MNSHFEILESYITGAPINATGPTSIADAIAAMESLRERMSGLELDCYELKKDLALNAQMLTRQTDLAREAENERDELRLEKQELDEAITIYSAKLAEQVEVAKRAEQERTLARGAMNAQDKNHRSQLIALGLHERFFSLTHLVDEMGEALLAAEREIENLKEGITRTATSVIMTVDSGTLSDPELNADFKEAFEWLRDNGQRSDFVADLIRQCNELRPESEMLKEIETLLNEHTVFVQSRNPVERIKFALDLADQWKEEKATLLEVGR